MISLGDIIMCHFSTLPVMLYYLGEHNTNLMLLFSPNTEPSLSNVFWYYIKTCPSLWCIENEQTVGYCICVIIYLFITYPAISVPLHLRHAAPVLLKTPCPFLDANMFSTSLSPSVTLPTSPVFHHTSLCLFSPSQWWLDETCCLLQEKASTTAWCSLMSRHSAYTVLKSKYGYMGAV